MEKLMDAGVGAAAAKAVDALGELSDAELEFVVGGLMRTYHGLELPSPSLPTLAGPADPLLKPPV